MKNILVLFFFIFTTQLTAQFAAEFNSVLIAAGQNGGDYRIRGQFFNGEPTKDDLGNVYAFSDVTTDSTTYVIDAQGRIFIVVGKGATATDGIDVVNTGGSIVAPSTGSKLQLTSLDPTTNEFFISAPIDQTIKAKIQRLNIVRRTAATVPDTLIGRAEFLDSLANIQAPDGGVNATFVRQEIADSLATIRPIKFEERIAGFKATSSSSFYQLASDLDSTRPIKVVVNGFTEPLDTTADGTGSGNVYYNPTLDRIVWKFSGYFNGDFVTILATKQ